MIEFVQFSSVVPILFKEPLPDLVVFNNVGIKDDGADETTDVLNYILVKKVLNLNSKAIITQKQKRRSKFYGGVFNITTYL